MLFIIIKEEKDKLERNEILKSIWTSIWRYFGLKGANKAGLWLLELDLMKNYGIIRCSNKTKEIIISSLTLIQEISGKRVILSPIKTSGTIKVIKRWKDLIIDKKI
ncbi:MAG: Rpp14/Pop5 family protein [Candidatus Thorarchaeota archaeon]